MNCSSEGIAVSEPINVHAAPALAYLDKAFTRGARVLACAAAAALAALLLLICANIVLRPMGSGIRGTAELGGYICALALGLSMPFSQLSGAHIGAGLWNRSLPRRARIILDMLVNLMCVAALGAAAIEMYSVAKYAMDMGEYIDGFKFSYYPMAVGLAIGLLLQGAVFARSLVKLFISSGAKV